MLAQTTFFVTLMTAIVLGVLTTNLISAGVARDHEIAKYTTIASDDAVDNFVSLMQSYVKEHGTEGPWPTAIPASAPIALCPDGSCPYTYTIEAKITGASTPSHPQRIDDQGMNLQKLVIREERVSATVICHLDDSLRELGTASRLITLRVTNGSPFAMVSGQRDLTANSGYSKTVEGDSGGSPDYLFSKAFVLKPLAGNPNAYHNTEIVVNVPCRTVDKIAGPDSTIPSHNQGRGNRQLPWGVGGNGGYELPCSSSFATPPPGSFSDEPWQNGNDI